MSAPGTITYVVSIINNGDTAVPAATIWEIHIEFTTGPASAVLSGDIVTAGLCAVFPPPPAVPPPGSHHVHCTSLQEPTSWTSPQERV